MRGVAGFDLQDAIVGARVAQLVKFCRRKGPEADGETEIRLPAKLPDERHDDFADGDRVLAGLDVEVGDDSRPVV